MATTNAELLSADSSITPVERVCKSTLTEFISPTSQWTNGIYLQGPIQGGRAPPFWLAEPAFPSNLNGPACAWLVAAAVSFHIAEWLWRYILGVLQQLADGLVVAVLFRVLYSVC